MFNLMKKGFQNCVLASFGVLMGIGAFPVNMQGRAQTVLAVQNHLSRELSSWKTCHLLQGTCSICMPHPPEHVKQIIPLNAEGYDLRYDVYVSAFEKKAVYMLLVAQYPPFVNQEMAENSLNSFLNGLLNQSENNRLISADLIDFHGNKALDFFIESKGKYFKGRAIMANHNLYLLAMECDMNNYLDKHYQHFIGSFSLNHSQ